MFLPDLFSKYKIEIISRGKTQYSDELIYYNDLDSDGNSERISTFINTHKQYSLQVFDHLGGILDQWNLAGTIPHVVNRFIAGDYNNDGIKEIFTLCQYNDSIFLYAFTPRSKNMFFIKHRFISELYLGNSKTDYSIGDMNVVQLDTSQKKYLVFRIAGGFIPKPRKLFIYDILEDTLISSRESGTIISNLIFIDLNHDGSFEIAGNTVACGNFYETENIPFSDYSSWLMVFDKNLNYLFHPPEFPGFRTAVQPVPFKYENQNTLLVLVNHTGPQENNPALIVFNDKGDTLKYKTLPGIEKIKQQLVPANEEPPGYLLINKKGAIYKINNDLNPELLIDLKTDISTSPLAHQDFDGDGQDEYLFNCLSAGKGIILRNNLDDPVIMNYPPKSEKKGCQSLSLIRNKGEKPKLYYQSGENYFIYEYGFNSMSLFQYPVYIGIYLVILALVFLIRKLQEIQMRDKLNLQSAITELQLKTINNQLDPHFTSNAFNAIAGLLKKEKGETAYNYFIKFSNLVKSNLISSDRIFRSLGEEINMVKNYLDIQKLRMKDSFDYKVIIDEKVDKNLKIPKMAIQNYAENAVKHGLRHKKEDGFLKIEIKQINKKIEITIEDNGIGREKAKDIGSDSTGMGMQMMQQYFGLLNKYNSMKIEQEVIDLFDDSGNPTGTKVIVEIPINIKYNMSQV